MTIIAVGSNIEPELHVPRGLEQLHASAEIEASSRFYQTAALHRLEQADYWNGCVQVAWGDDSDSLRELCRDIERREGRVRSADRWAARELDLDIIVWQDTVDPDVATREFLRQCLHDLGHPAGEDLGLAPVWEPPGYKAQ